MQDDVNMVGIRHFGIDIKSIDIVQVLLNRTYLLEITDIVKSSIWLIVVAIVFPNCLLDFFPSI